MMRVLGGSPSLFVVRPLWLSHSFGFAAKTERGWFIGDLDKFPALLETNMARWKSLIFNGRINFQRWIIQLFHVHACFR